MTFCTDSVNSLQLSPTDYKLAVEHYQAIGNNPYRLKEAPVAKYDPDIYPQGWLSVSVQQ